MKQYTPNIPIVIPEPEDITMEDVVDYLNTVLLFYGPPCNWCHSFDIVCERGYRPRNYELEMGPETDWTIRKYCKDFEPKVEEYNDKEKERMVRNMLNCNAQQYG